jgi:O-antigen ligase
MNLSPGRRRRRRESQPISAKERVIVGLVCVQISLAVWGVGLLDAGMQILFAALSLAGMIVVFFPQQVDLRWQDSEQTSRAAWSRLRSFPLFWAGLLLFAYVVIQALNPAFGYLEEPESWKAFPIDHIEWLPSSVAGPYDKLNPWRMLVILGGAWGLLCYAHTGLLRRKSLAFILWLTFATAIAFCVLTLVQKQLDAKKIYWLFEAYPNLFGSIPYKNRGATVLYLLMGCSMALYFYLVRRMHERGDKSGPHLLVLLGILAQYATLWSSFSRGGIAVGSVMMAVFFVWAIYQTFRESNDSWIVRGFGLLLLVFIAVGSMIAFPRLPDFERTLQRFNAVAEEIDSGEWNGRGFATRLTLNMFSERKWYGWGAASWRFVFPYYQIKFPEHMYAKNGKFLIWEDAHNDWAQYASEYGIVGLPMLLAFIFWPVGYLLIHLRSARMTQLILITTFMGLFFHSVIELLLQNQAILSLAAMLLVMTFRLPWSKNHKAAKMV